MRSSTSDLRNRVRGAVGAGVRTSTSAVARAVSAQRRDESAVDLVVAGLLARAELPELVDPPYFVHFLREAFRHESYSVTWLRAADGTDVDAIRFATMVEQIRTGMPPLSQGSAIRLALVVDRLMAERDPVHSTQFAGDVGLHVRIASSLGRKGRLLGTLARFWRATTALEIGTAYGMSSLFLADSLPPDGIVATIECAQPQLEVSGRVLRQHEPHRVRPIAGYSHEVVSEVAAVSRSFDLLFHDGAHAGDMYVQDFDTYEPLLRPGAVVLYDDIRWADERFGGAEAKCYEGWLRVVDHPRVRAAVELDTNEGLLLLRS